MFFLATSPKVTKLGLSYLDDSKCYSLGSAMLRFEPQPGSPRRLAMRVLQTVEPIKYARTNPDGTEHAVMEGSLLRNLKTGKLLTINIDRGKKRREMALLWPDNPFVVSFFLPLYFLKFFCRENSTLSNKINL